MASYEINTTSTSYRTNNSRDAASVACSQARNGLDPSAYAIVDLGAGVSVRRAEIFAGSIARTRKSLVAASK